MKGLTRKVGCVNKTTTAILTSALAAVAMANDGIWKFGGASHYDNCWTDYSLTLLNFWTDTSRWADGYIPVNGDSVYYTNSIAMYNSRPIYFQYIAMPTSDVAFDKLVGDSNRVLVSTFANSTYNPSIATFNDATEFYGAYRSVSRHGGFAFNSSTDISMFYADGYPYLGVPNESDTVTIKRFGGRGTVFKAGPGTLKVEDGSPDSRVRLDGGKLVLGGYDYPDELVAGYGVHLDASDTNAMTFADGADGRKYITRWNSAGASVYATSASDTRPYLRANYLNGLPVVDFGAFYSNQDDMESDARHAELGVPAFMNLSSTVTVKSFFFVSEEAQYTNSMPVVLGHESGANFYRISKSGSTLTTPTQSGLLFANYLNSNFVSGDFRMNAVNVPYNHGEPGGFARPIAYSGVTDENLDGSASINRIMRDRDVKWGGARLGEVVTYPTRLTKAQIRQNNAYLRKKWLGKTEEAVDCDVGTIYFVSNATVSVENGKTAQVPKLISGPLGACTLVKDGGGTLALDEIYPEKTRIRVKAGKIAFRDMVSSEQPQDDAPAAEPMFWVKADDPTHITTENGKVARWDDCRGLADVPYYIYWDSTRTYAKPDLVDNALANKPMVDFGAFQGNKTGPALMINGNPAPVEAFIVWQGTSVDSDAWIFASDGYDFTRSTGRKDTRILAPANANPGLLGAQWYMDGRAIDPENISLGTEAHVINYAALKGFTYNRIATDRTTSQNRSGGMKVGEIVLYNRILSGEERRRTQAYLLKRWKNQNHPRTAAKQIKEIVFDSGVQPEIEVDTDLVVGSIIGSGKLKLTGYGSLTLKSHLPDTITGIDAGKVRLATAVDPAETIRSKAILDLDASRTDTMSFDATDPSRVVEWRDANGGAYVAVNSAYAPNKPQLVDVTINGETKKSVCLFEFCMTGKGSTWTSYQSSTNNATGFDIKPVSGSWNGAGAFNAQEFFVVMADYNSPNPDHTHRANIVDSRVDTSSRYYRNGSNTGAIVRKDGYETTEAKQSSYMLDGTDHIDYGTTVTDFDYHVYTITQTNDVNIAISSYGWGATGGREWLWGGRYVCEVVYFACPLSDGERKVVHDYLRTKWQTATIANGTSCSEISLDGGAVSLDTNRVVTTSAIMGGGEITAKSVALDENGTLDFYFTGSNSVSTVTVDGAFALPSAFTLSVSSLTSENPVVGEYTLLSATSLSGDLRNGTIDVNVPGKHPVKVYAKGNSIKVGVRPIGVVLNFR